jgi:hypothetical protein
MSTSISFTKLDESKFSPTCPIPTIPTFFFFSSAAIAVGVVLIGTDDDDAAEIFRDSNKRRAEKRSIFIKFGLIQTKL